MKGKGFEVVATYADGSTFDRPVRNISDGEGWSKNYTDASRGQGKIAEKATFYIDGKPYSTQHQK